IFHAEKSGKQPDAQSRIDGRSENVRVARQEPGRQRDQHGLFCVFELDARTTGPCAKKDAIVLLQVLGRPRTPASLEIGGSGDEKPRDRAETPADERRVRQRSRSNAEVEAFLDEVYGAPSAEQFELDLPIAFEKIAHDGREVGDVQGSGHAQESPWNFLK